MVIHEQGQVPFPYNEGHSVLPSRSTSFGIRRVGNAVITIIIDKLFTVTRVKNAVRMRAFPASGANLHVPPLIEIIRDTKTN